MDINAKPYLTIDETCDLLGIGRSFFYRLMNRGEIPRAKIGTRVIIRREDVDEYLRSQIN